MTKRSFPRLKHILLIVVVVIAARASYYAASDGFSISKIENTFPVTSEWQLPAPTEQEQKELNSICSQNFRYLAKGSQAYAFISDDNKYVLKLYKCYHLKPAHWLTKMPLPETLDEMRQDTLQKRQKKIDDTLKSYKIAATKLKAECGLIELQILPTSEINQEVTLYDKLGRRHDINLGSYGFIIQKRADLIYPKLSNWIAIEDYTSAKDAIRSMVALIVERSKKGVQDSDPDLHKNSGLIGTTAILIDLGSFHENPNAKNEEVYMRDLLKITNRLKEWLDVQSPELAAFLAEEIAHASSSSWKKPH